MKWSKHRKTEVLIHSPLNCQPLNHLSGAEGWYLPSAPEQPTLTLLSALPLSPALLLAGLDGLTGRHGCREMWWQWALRSVFLYILDGRLYFPYDLFKTKKTPKILLIYPMNATRRVPILRVASACLEYNTRRLRRYQCKDNRIGHENLTLKFSFNYV